MAINGWAVFRHFEILSLTQSLHQRDDPDFSKFLDSIGDNADNSMVDLGRLRHMHSPQECIDFVFPVSILSDPVICAQRAILSPYNEFVDEFNSVIMSWLPGESRDYLSTDSIEGDENTSNLEGPLSDPDFLNSLTEPGVPVHVITLKVRAICWLTRNFDASRGLTKNTHVIIRHMFHHSVEVEMIPAIVAGEEIGSVRAFQVSLCLLNTDSARLTRSWLLSLALIVISSLRTWISLFIESRYHLLSHMLRHLMAVKG